MITFAPRLTTESQQTSGVSEEKVKIKTSIFFRQTLVKIKKMITFATPKRLRETKKKRTTVRF